MRERSTSQEGPWRSIIRSAVDGIVLIDGRGRIEAFNPAAERLFGYSEAEVVGQNVSMLMPQPYRGEHDDYLARYVATGDKKIIGIGREVIGQRRDGTTFPLHLSVGETEVDGEKKFTGIIHDLSTRVNLEDRLRASEARWRSILESAVDAIVVIDALAGIRGAIQVIGGRLPKESKDAAVVKEIVSRIDTLNELIKDLLLFARPPHPKPLPVDLAGLVRTTADLLTGDPALKGVAVRIDGTAPPVLADAELLKIVFQNLLMNSAQAMQGRGEIRVTLEPVDSLCRVRVRDVGPGIAADVLERIFTPFFTTKARGTGLGLATAKRIVEAHAGQIAIVSSPDEGTTVIIELPTARVVI